MDRFRENAPCQGRLRRATLEHEVAREAYRRNFEYAFLV